MSARPRTAIRFRRAIRRAALWLGLAAAFLPTLFPSLHAGHGFPMALHAANIQHVAHQAARHHHPARDHSSAGQHERDGDPVAPDHRPVNGACPICRTLQQIGAVVVPEIATVVERGAAGGEPVASPVVFISFAAPFNPTQPRAPPVDA